jgi:DNA-binding response OmpR family regulator
MIDKDNISDHEACPAQAPLHGVEGAAVLIVEDDWLMAEALQMSVEHAGYVSLSPADSVDSALEAIDRESVDVALLDVNLGGELVFPVADKLASRGVPFVFVTAYPETAIPAEHRHRPLVSKPFRDSELLGGLERALTRH